MEETGTTIHSRLTRRNNFLRENPESCQFAARERAKRHQGFTEGLTRAIWVGEPHRNRRSHRPQWQRKIRRDAVPARR